jgi:GTP cyclohydrolase FolE2
MKTFDERVEEIKLMQRQIEELLRFVEDEVNEIEMRIVALDDAHKLNELTNKLLAELHAL